MRQVGATLHRDARASHCRGLSCCGAQAPDTQAQQLWLTGLVAPRHVGSSQTRARTRVPCIGGQILNHCATREAPVSSVVKTFFISSTRCSLIRCPPRGTLFFLTYWRLLFLLQSLIWERAPALPSTPFRCLDSTCPLVESLFVLGHAIHLIHPTSLWITVIYWPPDLSQIKENLGRWFTVSSRSPLATYRVNLTSMSITPDMVTSKAS